MTVPEGFSSRYSRRNGRAQPIAFCFDHRGGYGRGSLVYPKRNPRRTVLPDAEKPRRQDYHL